MANSGCIREIRLSRRSNCWNNLRNNFEMGCSVAPNAVEQEKVVPEVVPEVVPRKTPVHDTYGRYVEQLNNYFLLSK